MKDALNAKVRRSMHMASLVAESEANSEESPGDEQLKDQRFPLDDRIATEVELKEGTMYRVGDQIESKYRGKG